MRANDMALFSWACPNSNTPANTTPPRYLPAPLSSRSDRSVYGTIIAPILLHASTDPSIFLQTTYPTDNPLGAFGSLGNIVVVLAGVVLLIVFIITQRRSDRAIARLS